MRKNLVRFCFLATLIALLFNACVNEQSVKYTRYFTDGAQLYTNNCQNCHSSKGEGLAQLIPPLTDTVFLRKNRTQLACIVQYGLADSITIHNKIYHFKMPSNQNLAPIDLAKLLTFVTNSFGNQQGLYDIAEVENNLKNCR
ncbi:MAG: cytochrome c [Sphingobacteriales bacterium]|nr:MAG: cytochrome c [Sphingobacteriales bacterium]TAF82410.1 MAG: cytochrome c [Sphingobacteriales bacterium]